MLLMSRRIPPCEYSMPYVRCLPEVTVWISGGTAGGEESEADDDVFVHYFLLIKSADATLSRLVIFAAECGVICFRLPSPITL